MRHRLKRRTLGRKTTARMSMLMAQVEALIEKERIKLPLVRAKQVRSIAEKLIAKSRAKTLSATRNIASKLINSGKVKKINELGSRYQGRAGGFTRIIKLGMRKGDAAKMALLELV